MEATSEVKYPGMRWVILILCWLSVVVMAIGWFMTASLAQFIVPALALTVPQFTLLLTGVVLGIAIGAIPGGTLGDRIGPRIVIFIGLLLIGVCGLLRGYTTSWGPMFAFALIVGIGAGFVMTNGPKVLAYWFPMHQIAITMGIFSTAIGVGQAAGLAIGALFPSYTAAYLVMGIAALVIALLWIIIARSTRPGTSLPPHHH